MDDTLLKMLLFFAAFSFAGWLLLFAGIGTRRDVRRREEEERTRTDGVIVDYVRREYPSGRRGTYTHWKPVVEFTAEGEKYRLEYANSMDRKAFPVGLSVEVLYDVSDPTRFHLATDPVYTDPGKGAIRFAIIWIVASAALSLALAVFVGGLDMSGFRELWHALRRLSILRR